MGDWARVSCERCHQGGNLVVGMDDGSFLLEGGCFTPSGGKQRLGCGDTVSAGWGRSHEARWWPGARGAGRVAQGLWGWWAMRAEQLPKAADAGPFCHLVEGRHVGRSVATSRTGLVFSREHRVRAAFGCHHSQPRHARRVWNWVWVWV